MVETSLLPGMGRVVADVTGQAAGGQDDHQLGEGESHGRVDDVAEVLVDHWRVLAALVEFDLRARAGAGRLADREGQVAARGRHHTVVLVVLGTIPAAALQSRLQLLQAQGDGLVLLELVDRILDARAETLLHLVLVAVAGEEERHVAHQQQEHEQTIEVEHAARSAARANEADGADQEQGAAQSDQHKRARLHVGVDHRANVRVIELHDLHAQVDDEHADALWKLAPTKEF